MTTRRITVVLTEEQIEAVLKALSECLDATDTMEQVGIFGSLPSARAASNADAELRNALYYHRKRAEARK